jgi:aminoglycoside phosphotransferase (APT) family kinase protein
MSITTPELRSQLETALRQAGSNLVTVNSLTRLSGGASQETWSVDAVTPSGAPITAILRRTPGGVARGTSAIAVSLDTEAAVLRAAYDVGVPVPQVLWVSDPQSSIGSAYLMEHIPGETIPRKILRDPAFATARDMLSRQCGAVLARIHSVDRRTLPPLPTADARLQWRQYRAIYESYDYPHPVFEVAFRWLEQRLPTVSEPTLVHGDFRLGNLMVGVDGLRAVLDWELTHIGDPAEDLGWICVNSWRFGVTDKVVGGFGNLEDLLAGYADAGGTHVTPERVRYWQIFGTLKWGIMCMTMVNAFSTGADPSVERAAIGRRSSETEIDLLNLIYPKGGTL